MSDETERVAERRFQQLAQLVYEGAHFSIPAEQELEQRGVRAAIEELELMRVYGGYSQLMDAPAWHVQRTRLLLKARSDAAQGAAERMNAVLSGTVNSAAEPKNETHISVYYPHCAE